MQIIVLADENTRQELTRKIHPTEIHTTFIENFAEIGDQDEADAVFLLKEEAEPAGYRSFTKTPVFINATVHTLEELELPGNFNRINGWPTFLDREIWEIATTNENAVKRIFDKLGWKYINVADEPGLISARIISMIINEAYYALGEDVSSKEEIDVAMKLGTNYPYGPFEWGRIIGLKKVYSLLEKLSTADSRYHPAPALKTEVN